MVAGDLNGKRFLITAGPTWVAVDAVRVLSNVSSGAMGLALAKEALKRGASVDLCLGPVGLKAPAGARVFRFKYFKEFLVLVDRRLRAVRYDVIVHAAAVSDYLAVAVPGKIPSGEKVLTLRLSPAPKIVDRMRRRAPRATLVMFKLEVGVTDAVLLRRAVSAMRRSGADIVVANKIEGKDYKGFVLGAGVPRAHRTKRGIAHQLMRSIAKGFSA